MRLEIGASPGVVRILPQRLHRLVGDNAAFDAIFAGAHEVVDPWDGRIEGPSRDQSQEPGYLDLVSSDAGGEVGDPKEGKTRGRGLGVPHRLDGGDLHF